MDDGERGAKRASNALDAFGYASMTVRVRDGKVLWQTPLARELLRRYGGQPDAAGLPRKVLTWLKRVTSEWAEGAWRDAEPPRLSLEQGHSRLSFRLHSQVGEHSTDDELERADGEWLLIMQESLEAGTIGTLVQVFGLTVREAEILYWVAQGKINRDIADIVGCSPATVKKHLERILYKLGVETRTAAAAMAIKRVGVLRA
jgi:DNA-binding CsgD family transcriptional regulator